MPSIYVVGVGLEGKQSLLPTTQELLASADLILASQRLMDLVQPESANKWILSDFSQDFTRINSYIDRYDESTVVILATGDPLFFGIGRLILNYIAEDLVTFIPHVSSIQLAFSRLKMSWQNACFVSVHGRGFDELIRNVRQGHSKIAVLTDLLHSPAAIASSILALDLPITYRAWVCENLGAEQEKINSFSLRELLQQKFSALSVVVLVRQTNEEQTVDLSQLPLMGIPDHLFHTFDDRPGLMTKREIRLLALGELALQAHHVCWDIGAGTGSMSIEMARLVPQGYIYALERTSAGMFLVQRNQHKFCVGNLNILQGNAPDCLDKLPPPHRIFIGGSGHQLSHILTSCASRLIRSGRIVLAIATLETLNEALMWFNQHQWQVKILQVQLSKSLPIADRTRFNPMNPVYLVTANPKE